MVCDEVPGSNSGQGLPGWAVALIILVVMAVFGGLAFYFLKKKCSRGFTFVLGGILAGSMTPPIPTATFAQNGEAPQSEIATAPPNSDEIMSV